MTFDELCSALEDVILETITLPKKDAALLVDALAAFIVSDLGIEVDEEEEEDDE